MKRILGIFFCLLPSLITAQVTISYPHNRQVFQRNNANEANFSILGNCVTTATSVQVKLVPVQANQGTLVNWTSLDANPAGGLFQGQVKAKGGWYTLWIRSLVNGKALDSTSLSRVGVGENFIIAGQSNAQGTMWRQGEKGAVDDRVICANVYSFFTEYNQNPDHRLLKNLTTDFPFTDFAQMSDQTTIGPLGLSKYYWAKLGDSLVTKLNVPVCFINVAWLGTSMQNWAESSRGLATENPWAAGQMFATGFPYNNLKRASELYGVKNGVRAILWHQGESDTYHKKVDKVQYKKYFVEVIETLRRQTGLTIPWVISEVSFGATAYYGFPGIVDGTCTTPLWNPEIIAGQKEMLTDGIFTELYSGPNTDQVEIPRANDIYASCVHFTPNAYSQLADLWEDKLNASFFANSKPVLPALLPSIMLQCGPANELVVSTKSNFAKTQWLSTSESVISTQSTKQTLSPGKYSLRFEDALGNEFSVPAFEISNLTPPQTPVVTSKGELIACQGGSVELSVSSGSGSYRWSTNDTLKVIKVTNSGAYTVSMTNSLGCKSALSAPVQVSFLDLPAKPSLTVASPYFIAATQKPAGTEYIWKQDGRILTETGSQLRVNASGTYSVYAAKKYSPAITCLSTAADLSYILPADGGMSFYPNPMVSPGSIIQSVSDLKGAVYTLYAVDGRLVLQGVIPTDGAFLLPSGAVGKGLYKLVLATSSGTSYTRSILVNE
ncbi:sialate O-acetylesterase [Aquirufa sp. OSTEICH-129V]|uniref:Sialate O-acetylesterase n=1 Tax=Aquirufa avitistagni TaxID=3104728 RepID=A0ABW6DDL0_9BACT